MLRWTDRLQQRFGFLAVPGLGRYIVTVQALCFLGALLDPGLYGALTLDPALVAQGQFWRLLTFLFLPSLSPLDILFAVFYFMFQWMVFEGLEAEWGAFKLTLYCALGWLCALALPVLAYAVFGADWPASGAYWSVSIELAFAFLYPDFTIYIYLILPVKMKWMAWLIGAFLLYQVFSQGWPELLPIGVGLLNYFIFFGPELVASAIRGTRAQKGRQVFIAARRQAEAVLGPRACARCGAGNEAFLRLCCCARCGAEGRLWCDRHLPEHLAETAGTDAAPKPEPKQPEAPSPSDDTPTRKPLPKRKSPPRAKKAGTGKKGS